MRAVDRDTIPSQYAVLPVMPLATASETIRWTTQTFVACNLSETRTALTLYPDYTITYNFKLSCSRRSFLLDLYSAGNEWMLPYYPFTTPASITDDKVTVSSANDQAGASFFYPYGDYFMVFGDSRQAILLPTTKPGMEDNVYEYPTDGVANQLATDSRAVWAVPCFVAYLKPDLSYSDTITTDGSAVALTWRMSGDAERVLSLPAGTDVSGAVTPGYDPYSAVTPTFDFLNTVQRPKSAQVNRHQSLFEEQPARSATYTPNCADPSQTTIENVSYPLRLDTPRREEFSLRRYFLKYQGSAVIGEFVNRGQMHRLADDTLTINYTQRHAMASTRMRRVA